MTPSVNDIIAIMEQIAPTHLAQAWDNVGLQIGQSDWPVKSIWLALDPSPQVVRAACSGDCDLLITHHPLFFKPLKQIIVNTPVGDIIARALGHRLAIFAAHTNLDTARGGLNDHLARILKLIDIKALQEVPPDLQALDGPGSVQGLGRVGNLVKPLRLRDLAYQIKTLLEMDHLRVAGREDLLVKTVALCTGSGSSMMSDFLSCGAQVLISGDLHYHDARDAWDAGVGLIDVGHFSSEHPVVTLLTEKIEALLAQKDMQADVHPYFDERDPFHVM